MEEVEDLTYEPLIGGISASIKSPVGPVETIRFNMIITMFINTNDVVSCLLFFSVAQKYRTRQNVFFSSKHSTMF